MPVKFFSVSQWLDMRQLNRTTRILQAGNGNGSPTLNFL